MTFIGNSCNHVSITDIISYMWPIRRLHWASRQEVQATKLLVINMASCVAHWVTFLWRARLHCHRARVDFCLIRTALMNWRVDRQCRVVPPQALTQLAVAGFVACTTSAKNWGDGLGMRLLRGWPGNETTDLVSWVCSLASFPGLPTVWFLIAYSMQKWRGKAWVRDYRSHTKTTGMYF